MAINDNQKLDFLWKKLGYGVSKTDINSIKNATNESIPSPLLIRGDRLWAEADQIPTTIPSSDTSQVQLETIETTADATASANRTWKTGNGDWIPPEFGSTYQVKVYLDNSGAANPASTGTQLFAAGSGNNDEWFFDYQSGVLNFIGDNLPSGISGKAVYIIGARYIGNFGISGTTDGIVEGATNLYYTDERVDDRVANLILDGQGITKSYDDAGNLLNIAIDFTEFDSDDIIEGAVNTFLASRTTDDIPEGSTNLYYTDARVDTNFATKTTTDLTEGTNLYYTDARVQTYLTANNYATISTVTQQVAAQIGVIQSDLDDEIYDREQADLNLQSQIDNLVLNDLTDVSVTSPTSGDALVWNGTSWIPQAPFSQADFDSAFAAKTTTDLAEGTNLYYTEARVDANFTTKTTTDLTEGTNLYYTDERVDDRVAALIQDGVGITKTYDDAGNLLNIAIDFTEFDSDDIIEGAVNTFLASRTTDDIPEGSTNLYYTEARFDARLATKSTTDLAEGTNLYFTEERVDDRVAALIQAGEDISVVYDDVANTLTIALASSVDGLDLSNNSTDDLSEGSTNLYYTDVRVDANFATKTTTDLTEGTNLYYTDARFDARLATKTTTDLTEGTNLYYTEARVDANIATKTTDDITEGATNLYYTDERVDDRVANLFVDGKGLTKNYDDVGNLLNVEIDFTEFDTDDIVEGTVNTFLANRTTDDVAEGSNNLYYTDGRTDARIALQTGANLDLSQKTTTELSEGTNLYYTDSRVQTYLTANNYATISTVTQQVAAQISSIQSDLDDEIYDREQGDLALQNQIDSLSTTDVAEGTNLYYTDARFDARLAAKTTTDLTEGTNLYYTDARVQTKLGDVSGHIIPDTDVTYDLGSTTNKFRDLYLSGSSIYLGSLQLSDNNGALEVTVSGSTEVFATETYVDTAISNLIDTAPTTLDTLNELAAALGDDPNFSTTITNLIGTKLATADFNTTADTWLGTKSTTDLSEGTNLYYTDARVDARISLQTGTNLSLANKTTDDLSEGSTNLYYTEARVDANFATKSTTDLAEGTNLYYTDARFDTRLATKSTTDIVEGTNLYYTDERVDDRVAALIQAGEDISVVYDDVNNTLTIALASSIDGIDLSNNTTDDLSEGSTNLYYTDARVDARITASNPYDSSDFDTDFSGKSTTDLTEGTNLYYTDARADARVAAANIGVLNDVNTTGIATGDFLLYDGSEFLPVDFATEVTTYADSRINLASIQDLSDVDAVDTPANGDVLLYDAGNSNFGFINLGNEINSYFDIRFATKNTDDLTEGTTNLYYTDARVQTYLTANNYATVSTVTQQVAAQISSIQSDLDDEIYDREQADIDLQNQINTKTSYATSDFDTDFATKSTTDLAEGTNLYYTDARADARITTFGAVTQSDIDASIAALVDSAPTTLDTLNELAAALGDDPNFATTITNSIATKLAIADFNTTADTWLGTKSTTDLAEGTNLYYTDARVDSRINLQTGTNLSLANKTTDDLIEGSTNFYYTDARFDTRLATKSTTDLAEGTNLYYTDARFDTRLSTKTTDNLTEGSTNLYYTDARVDARITAANLFDGQFSSLTNTPTTLAGYGITDGVSTSQVTSIVTQQVAAQTGAIQSDLDDEIYDREQADIGLQNQIDALTTTDVAEGTNLYYTDARVQSYLTTQGISTETLTSLAIAGNVLTYTDENGNTTNIDLSLYLDDTNLARLVSGSLNGTTGIATFTRDDATTFTIDFSPLFDDTNLSRINSATFTNGTLTLTRDDSSTAATVSFDGRYLQDLSASTTDDLAEGLTNLYYTQARFDTAFISKTTTDLTEGVNLYYTDVRVRTHVESQDLDLGTNKVLFSNMYANLVDLPSATSYHGMFAHVHGTGKAYYAHSGSWIELANVSEIPTTYTDSDVDTHLNTSTATTGQTLIWNGIDYSWGTPPAGYADSDVDTHLNTSTATSNQVLSWDGTDYDWIAQSSVTTSANPPSSPSNGDLWFDTDELKTYIYYDNGTTAQWVQSNPTGAIGTSGGTSIEISDVAPSSPSAGDLWFDSDALKTFIYYDDGSGAQWIESSGGGGSSIADTDALPEGSTNLYYTDARVQSVSINEVVEDTTPTLGGNLNSGGFNITNISADGYSLPVADGTNRQVIMTDGSGTLSFENLDTIHTEVTNQTGSTILKGTPVYQTGTSGNAMTIASADASSSATMPAVGVLEQDLVSGATGFVIHMGKISGVDTSAFNEGDIIYVAVGGGYTNTPPVGESNLLQNLGRVTKVHASNGAGVIMGAGRTNAVSNLNDGNIFIGDSSNRATTASLNTSVQNYLSNLSGSIIPDTDVTYDLGSSTHKFRDLYLSGNSIILGGITLTESSGSLLVTPTAGGANNTFATESYVDTAISNLVDTAPTTLDTLNELAAALGDDPNFATTITNLIGTKLATADFNTTADSWLTTKSTTNLSEGTNLYYTDARADARVNLQTGTNLDLSSKTTTDLAEGINLYYTQARFDSAFTAKSTTDLSEGTNLYYTDARVRAHVEGQDLDLGTNKVLFSNMYATTGDLPSATSYHGMFAHVHGTGKAYYAHSGSWIELANDSQIVAQDFSWSSITGTPTTLAGYGITDGFVDADVDTHLNTSTATSNQVLSWNGTDYAWVAQSGGGGGASVSVSDTAPTSPSEGDLWFNSSNTKMYVYFNDGTSSQWIQSNPSGATSPITASDTAPTNPVENSMWFDSTDGTLYFRYNDGTSEQWVNLIGATSNGGGGGGGSSVTVSDTAPTTPTEGDMWFDSRYAVLLVYYGTQWVNVSGESGSSTTPSWQETTNHTASVGDKLFVDCSGGAVTVTLPVSPSMGDEIRIIDATGNASTNNITIARNGSNIQGVADNLIIDTDRAAFGLVYYNSTQGWLLMER